MYTPVVLDKARNFRYGMKSLALIERKFGKPLARIDFGNMTLDEMCVILWAGLEHEDKELTPEKLMDIIDQNNIKLNPLLDMFFTGIEDAYGPDGGESEGENPKKAAAE